MRRFIHELKVNSENQSVACEDLRKEIEKVADCILYIVYKIVCCDVPLYSVTIVVQLCQV